MRFSNFPSGNLRVKVAESPLIRLFERTLKGCAEEVVKPKLYRQSLNNHTMIQTYKLINLQTSFLLLHLFQFIHAMHIDVLADF